MSAQAHARLVFASRMLSTNPVPGGPLCWTLRWTLSEPSACVTTWNHPRVGWRSPVGCARWLTRTVDTTQRVESGPRIVDHVVEWGMGGRAADDMVLVLQQADEPGQVEFVVTGLGRSVINMGSGSRCGQGLIRPTWRTSGSWRAIGALG